MGRPNYASDVGRVTEAATPNAAKPCTLGGVHYKSTQLPMR